MTEIERRLPDDFQHLDCRGLLVGYLFQLPLKGADALSEVRLSVHRASALTSRVSGEQTTPRLSRAAKSLPRD